MNRLLNLDIKLALEITGGRLISGLEGATAGGISIDSRAISPGEIFIAIKGSSHDGHDFVVDALGKGAAGAIVERGKAGRYLQALPTFGSGDRGSPPALIEVEDTLASLQEIARSVRRRFGKVVVAVTGTNGKSTVKEMIGSILRMGGCPLVSHGNMNNLIGLPLNLLRLTPDHDAAVLEMGMNAPGEIRRLCAIAEPSMGLITNVAPAHLEGLKSVEGVARAKRELIEWLDENDPVILNADDPNTPFLRSGLKRRYILFGASPEADVRGCDATFSEDGWAGFSLLAAGEKVRISLPFPGRHNVHNALAAAAAALKLGVGLEEVVKGLETYKGLPMRMEIDDSLEGILVINDSYNANPASMRCALETFRDFHPRSRSHAVLGDMLELGEQAEALHHDLGLGLKALPIDHLYTVGPAAAHLARGALKGGMPEDRVHICNSIAETVQELDRNLQRGDKVLIKGSRRMEMEKVLKHLQDIRG